MTDKPKRVRRAKKPLGSHPLDPPKTTPQTWHPAVIAALSERKPFYTAPRRRCAGPMLTNDDLRERELDENRRGDPLGYWGTFRDEVV